MRTGSGIEEKDHINAHRNMLWLVFGSRESMQSIHIRELHSNKVNPAEDYTSLHESFNCRTWKCKKSGCVVCWRSFNIQYYFIQILKWTLKWKSSLTAVNSILFSEVHPPIVFLYSCFISTFAATGSVIGGDEIIAGNVNKYTVLPTGYSGQPKKGHLVFDACFESGKHFQYYFVTKLSKK